MREWWANVYIIGGEPHVLWKAPTRGEAVSALCDELSVSCRIHVRLKPEGAPRRYASTWERWGWENTPETMREMREREAFYGGHQWTPEQIARMSARTLLPANRDYGSA